MLTDITSQPLTVTIRPIRTESANETRFFSEDIPSFEDVLDAINPLQQLPVISSFYRAESGDGISILSRLLGGALVGGPIGFLVAAVNSGIEAATGSDIGEHMLAMFDSTPANATSVANAASRYNQTQNLV